MSVERGFLKGLRLTSLSCNITMKVQSLLWSPKVPLKVKSGSRTAETSRVPRSRAERWAHRSELSHYYLHPKLPENRFLRVEQQKQSFGSSLYGLIMQKVKSNPQNSGKISPWKVQTAFSLSITRDPSNCTRYLRPSIV